jgi:hypothetical protein
MKTTDLLFPTDLHDASRIYIRTAPYLVPDRLIVVDKMKHREIKKEETIGSS